MHAVYNFRVSIELKSLQIPYKGGRTTQRMRGRAAWMNRWEKRKNSEKTQSGWYGLYFIFTHVRGYFFCDFVNRYLSVSTYIEEVFSLKFGLTKPRSCIYDEIKFFECLEKVDFHFRIVTVMHDWRQT